MWKKTLITAGVVLGLLAAAHQIWTATARKKYQAELDYLKREGESIGLTAFAGSPVPDGQNIAAGLAEAHAWLDADLDRSLGPDALGKDRIERTEDEQKTVDQYIESLAPYYEMVEGALERPHFFLAVDWDQGPAAKIPSITWAYEAGHKFKNLVLDVERPADLSERLIRAVRVKLRMAERCEIPGVLGVAMTHGGQAGAIDDLLAASQRKGFQASVVRPRLEPLLRKAEPKTGPPADALRMERAMAIWCFSRWTNGESAQIDDAGERLDTWESSWLGRPFVYLGAVETLRYLEKGIAACGVKPEEGMRVAARMEKLRVERKFPYPQAPFEVVVPNLFKMYTRRVALLRLARVGLAVLDFRERTGDWPESLEALDESLPLDPLSDKPFRYERGASTVRLQSAGSPDDDSLVWTWER